MEVFKLTGQRLSHLQTQFDEGQPASQAKVFVLSWPREELHRRIDARVEQMFAAGLVEEVRGLMAKYGTLEPDGDAGGGVSRGDGVFGC